MKKATFYEINQLDSAIKKLMVVTHMATAISIQYYFKKRKPIFTTTVRTAAVYNDHI